MLLVIDGSPEAQEEQAPCPGSQSQAVWAAGLESRPSLPSEVSKSRPPGLWFSAAEQFQKKLNQLFKK